MTSAMFSNRGKPDHGRPSSASIYQQGLADFETARYLEAINKLATIADERSLPGTLARFYLGQSHLQQGIVELNARQFRSAATHFSEARRINPDSAGLSRYLTACHLGQDRFDLAAAEMERTRATNAADTTLPIRLAHALVRDGQFERAVQTLTDATNDAPHRADYRFQLALLHASTGHYELAIELLNQAAEKAPLDSAIQQHLGLALAALGRTTEAVAHLAAAQRLCPGDAYLGLLLALALDSLRESSAAVSGIQAAPVSVDSCSDDPALIALGEVIMNDSDFVEAFLSLPSSQVDQEIFAMLAATLERALERRPDYADLHYHCSRVYQRLGRTDAAINQAGAAVRLNPRYTQALIQLGRLYAETDRRAEAIDRLQSALAAGGDYPDVHFLLGELYRKGGEKVQARSSYRRALELNSNYRRAREALELVSA